MAASLLPPLLSLAVSRCVVRPLLRWHSRRRDLKLQRENAVLIRSAVVEAKQQVQVISTTRHTRTQSNMVSGCA